MVKNNISADSSFFLFPFNIILSPKHWELDSTFNKITGM